LTRTPSASSTGLPWTKHQREYELYRCGSEDSRSILMFTMLGAFAQFEWSLIKERQREGIALAKAKGTVSKGRKPALNAERIAQLREQAAAGTNRTKLAKEFGISRETLYQYIRSSKREPVSYFVWEGHEMISKGKQHDRYDDHENQKDQGEGRQAIPG
jgi:DNA invertase Pin-like site-specific DNA recombinase